MMRCSMQLKQRWDIEVDDRAAKAADICGLVEAAALAYEEVFIMSQSAALVLNVQPFSWPFSLWLGGCEAQLDRAKDTGSEAVSDVGLAANLLLSLANGASDLQLTRRLYMVADTPCSASATGQCGLRRLAHSVQIDPTGIQQLWAGTGREESDQVMEAQRGLTGPSDADVPSMVRVDRRLLAKTAAKSSSASGGVQPAVRTSDTASEQWTTEDVRLNSSAIPGSLLPPRMLGTGNVILGGVMLKQVCCPRAYTGGAKSAGECWMQDRMECMSR